MYIIYDNYLLKHSNPYLHPEKAERLTAIMKDLANFALSSELKLVQPEPVELGVLSLIHKQSYIEKIEEYSKREGMVYLDVDTVVSAYSYQCALLAAGAGIRGMDLIFNQDGPSSFFSIIRPPGHHAFSDRGSGFCIFNNIAVAAAYSMSHYQLNRVLIIDFDAHHGNGTQDIFYHNQNLFYISFHQYPHYPGTGKLSETGAGSGKGYNLNFPLPAGTGEDCYIFALKKVVMPLMARFKPDLILVSAGFDSHRLDPLSSLCLNQGSYYNIMRIIDGLSKKYCQGRLGIFLEGGYNTEVLGVCARETIRGCLSPSREQDSEECNSTDVGESCISMVDSIKHKFGINNV